MKTARRIGAVVASIGLAAALASCSGGQSVADACKVAEETMTGVVTESQTEIQSQMEAAMSGGEIDLDAALQPVQEALKDTQSKVTNEDVKKPLDAFVGEYNAFVKVVQDADLAGMAELQNLDPSDPEAMAKAQELQAEAQTLQTEITDATKKLQDASNDLQSTCNA